jgi:hypothetical protein
MIGPVVEPPVPPSEPAAVVPSVPRWRVILGGVVAAVGTLVLFVPALIAGSLGHDTKTGRCYADDLFGDMCHISPAEGYGTMIAMLAGPAVVGLLIAFPRRAEWWLAGIILGSIALWALLSFVGETVPPTRPDYDSFGALGPVRPSLRLSL